MKLIFVAISLIFASVCYGQQTVSKEFLMGEISAPSLQKEVAKQFKAMQKAIRDETGIRLTNISGRRDYKKQKEIWESKWCGKKVLDERTKVYFAESTTSLCKRIKNELANSQRKSDKEIYPSSDLERARKILEFTAMPGTSRHHWGTDIDINHTDPSYWDVEPGKTVYAWLKQNASKYGFCQVYSEKSSRGNKGYEQEKWHWSYMPLAKTYLAEFKKLVTADDVKSMGFLGSNIAASLMDEYVSSINLDCNEL